MNKIVNIFSRKKVQRRIRRCVSLLSCIIVFVTTYAMMLPSLALERNSHCGQEEHEHTADCFEKILTCGLEESEEHVHTEACFENVLACGKEMHVHNLSCYETEEEQEEEIPAAEEEDIETAEETDEETDLAEAEEEAEESAEVLAEAEAIEGPEAAELTEMPVLEAVPTAGILETEIVTADGETYQIVIEYSAEACIPVDAQLVVSEIREEDAGYEEHLEGTAAAIDKSVEEIAYVRLFDIEICAADGTKIEPAVPVQVRITCAEPVEMEKLEDLQIVHFGEAETEVIAPQTEGVKEGTVDEILFEAASFSVYSVVSVGVPEDGKLNGRTFALIGGTSGNALQGEALSSSKLAAAKTETETRDGKAYIRANEDITFWTFESDGKGKYYIRSEEGLYLNINGARRNGKVTVSGTRQALTVTEGTGSREGRIRIKNSEEAALNNFNGSASGGYGAYDDNGNNEWFALYDMVSLNPEYAAEKISVQELQDAQRVVIYRSVYNEESDRYEDYVIDGNGELIKAFDKGNQVVGRSAVSPVWVVTFCQDENLQLNGYYIFQNVETGLCLAPASDGSLVAPYGSSTTSGVTLNGRRDGGYVSTIEKWDDSAWGWYGYEIHTGSESDPVLASAGRGSSREFSFAAYVTETTAELHPVSTVDSSKDGITIHLFNYPNRSTISNVTGSDSYKTAVLPAQHAGAKLVNGYPVFKNGKSSGEVLFNPSGSYHKGTGNHLFLDSIYQSTGYYEYNAFHNFAHYNSDGNFTVYQETGTPSNDKQLWYQRGNYFPFNDLDITRSATNTNRYDGNGNLLDIQDPTDGGTLYLINNPDFYFGMTMEATFMQPRGGQMSGGPVLYEFNGDDDLWIYIDGVLVLDIGGVHDAWSGTINFATGEIDGRGAGGASTIKACFRNAGVLPDGTPWNDNRAEQFFKGETFADYSSHSFKMFYMEHGAGASNLEMRFNLPVIEKGRFTVEKELDGTEQQRFSNVYFAYQAFCKEDGVDVPLTEAVYEGTNKNVTFYPSVEIGGKTYTNVFYLKPGEAATFAEMPGEAEYYVQELGVGTDYYDEIIVNDVKIDGIDASAKDGIYPTPVAAVENRARVTYTNHCSEKNLNDLRITKALVPGCVEDGTTFEFRVLLENADGALAPYSTGEYSIQNADGDYFRYENGKLVNNGKTPIVASVAGNNGTIAGIPAGYTVVISGLLADTDFYVEEIRLPEGWELESKETVEGTFAASSLEGTDWSGKTVTADGQILLDTDAEVIFTNRGEQRLIVRKVWESGDFVSLHGDIHVALFTEKEDGSLELAEGTLRTISAPADSVEYQVTNLANLTAREVLVEEGTVKPVEEGGAIVVSGETTAYSEAADNSYYVSYEQGEVQTEDENGEAVTPVRTDIITNAMPSMTVNKTDLDGRQLADAEFTLLIEDAQTPLAGFEHLVSDDAEEGNLITDLRLSDGTYYLEEAKAPAGYNQLANRLKITVEAGRITMKEDTEFAPRMYQDSTSDNKMVYTFAVINNPGVALPSTGGVGTTLFYLLGAVLTIGAGVMLALRRRGVC